MSDTDYEAQDLAAEAAYKAEARERMQAHWDSLSDEEKTLLSTRVLEESFEGSQDQVEIALAKEIFVVKSAKQLEKERKWCSCGALKKLPHEHAGFPVGHKF